MKGIAQLTGTVKHYDWGGNDFIPSLLHLDHQPDQPFAEFWMGTHPQADCKLTWPDGSVSGLREFLQDHPAQKLGEAVWKRFGQLPYLFKALDVRDMLSIQVHPAKEAAVRDFAAEEAAGIPRSAPHRNYKDDNHKPELMVAMGPFWLLHGFRPADSMKDILAAVPELQFLLPMFEKGGYGDLYKTVMELPQEEVNERLQPLLDRIIPRYQRAELDKMHPDFWAARAALTFNTPGRIDRGIFSVYLFNLVYTEPGDAVFQDAGLPHAYLEGHNIEIMASSDNVLRGGLTSKHVDVPELLKHTRCEPTEPSLLHGELLPEGFRVYKTPAPDFELSSLRLSAGSSTHWTAPGAEIYLLTKGEARLSWEGQVVELKPGQPAALQLAGTTVKITAIADTYLFKAGTPVDK